MRGITDGSGRWGVAWTFAGALFIRAWRVTPLPAGQDDLDPPFVTLLVACLPLGLLVAVASRRLARGGSGARAAAWIVAAVYGAWVGAWASLMVETGGRLECASPETGCGATTGQRVATLVAVVLVISISTLVERRPWTRPSAPS